MCPCKKKRIIKYLEGFFEYVGSPQSGSRAFIDEVYSDLLTSLYQLDDYGNKVILDCSKEDSSFFIDVDKPVYVGSLRDNSDSNYVTEGFGHGCSNLYNDIVNLGFKPVNHEYPEKSITLRSFIIDAEEDSVLPISHVEGYDDCRFSNDVRALCLPKVNFYIYVKYDSSGRVLPQYNGYYGIKRNGYEMIGNYEYPSVSEDTGAVDSKGRIIQRYPVSVLMLPIHNADSNKFKLLGHSNGKYGSEYDVEIEEYSFDSSVDYGQEVNAKGVYDLVHFNFVNADSNHADLVPTDSYQFIGRVTNKLTVGDKVSNIDANLGIRWGDSLNDIYCNLSGSLNIYSSKKRYIENNVDNYITRAFWNGIYNTKFFNNRTSIYLYSVENPKNISISDTIELGVKRLPVINLTGRLLKSAFDSSKPYIYVIRDGVNDYGLLLCKYTDLDSDLILQVTDDNTRYGQYTKLTKQTGFTIYCSSTAPNDSYLCNKNDGNATDVYRLVCQPTEMNEEVHYTLTKL